MDNALTLADLQKFCIGEAPQPPWARVPSAPFAYEGYTIATDRAIVVRVKGVLEGAYKGRELPNVAAVFSRTLIEVHAPLSAYTIPGSTYITCEPCGGKGVLDECPKCNGRGEIACQCSECDDEHYRECGECEGQPTPEGGIACEACGSKGSIAVVEYVHIGTRYLNNILLNKIATLPNVRISTKGEETSLAYFTFDGGDGVIAPIRRA